MSINLMSTIIRGDNAPAQHLKLWIASIAMGTNIEGRIEYRAERAKEKGFATPLDWLFHDLKHHPELNMINRAMQMVCRMYKDSHDLETDYNVRYLGNDAYCIMFAIQSKPY